MVRLISWLIMVPLAIVVVVFTIANRSVVSLDLWPMPVAIDVPVFLLGLVGCLVGFLAGAVISWFSGGHRRATNRRLVRQLEAAQRQETVLRDRIAKLEQAQPSPAPELVSTGNLLSAPKADVA